MSNATTQQNFEKDLPSGYSQALYINATDKKFGIIFNAISIAIFALVMCFAFFSLRWRADPNGNIINIDFADSQIIVAYLTVMIAMIAYIVLHELVHGAAYKSLTGEKLTFGMSWSCAFCGVPNIYTYRRTAIIAVVAPFACFTLLLIPLLILLYFFSPLYYLVTAVIFGLHFGGCSGDLYVLYLLMFKFKDPKVLMRDTGPEQYFYVPDAENAENIEV